ncbi:serine-rich adhesin for platelets-like isoform X2 [Labrus bergylta]|uniref:serine-rich adhesin for platelets-like isoform X2 n=1 Tax=Labrus bergylta TaxID=56723 RepID=UPI003313EBF8
MEKMSLGCQVCCAKFQKMFEIKKHMCSKMHQTKMKEIFKKEKFNNLGFPFIVMMNPQTQIEMKHPIVGLSLLTLCFSPESKIFFYLCHVCEEKCFPKNIVAHLSSSDHCSNYFNYTDPDVLSFSWIPGLDMRDILRHEITKVTNKPETRRMQMLDLPADLLKKLDSRTYSEVIRSLSDNDKLVKLFKAVRPKRTMIQKYQTDSNRKHPLLGMQHIVECISVGPTERGHYLCTLCKLTLAPHVIIKHVLSFDHIYCYFREWHPSTLLSKESYTAHTTLTIMSLDLAKQTLEIHATTNTDMKQVRLEPDEFTSVNFTCYSDALDKLESIRQKKKESSLITVPTPGKKLESHYGLSLLSVRIYCQDCGSIFNHVSPFSSHLKSWHHQQTVKNTFGKDSHSDCYEPIEKTPYLKLYSHLRDKRKQRQQAVGVSLVVTFISSEVQVEPICVCFACSDCFMESSVIQHLNSQKHIIHTLLYLNPWRLPLAWKNIEDVRDLWSAAWSEDREREPDHMTMKILDLPYWMFQELFPPSYSKVTMTLTNYNTFLKREVPKCETFSKLKENESFPLLGRQFIAMHYLYDRLHQPTEVAFLCMLCRRRLSDQECHAHVFSREHITLFINHFHPGSMTSKTDLETVLDLAKQAERHHSTMNVQEIQLDRSIREPCSYKTAYSILANAKLRKSQGKLLPNIFPKQKLVPRATLKDKDVVRDNSLSNSGMLPGSKRKSCQKSPDNCKKTRVGAEITDEKCAERGGNEEEEVDMKRLKSEQHAVETCTEDTKSPVSETLQAIKEEEIEELIVCKPSEGKTESCKYRDMDLKSEITEQSNKNTQTHSMNNACKEETTRHISMCKESQGAFCYEDMEENTSCKKGLPAPKQDASCEVEQRLPISIQKKETAAEVTGRETKPSQQSVKHEASTHQQPDRLWQYLCRTSRETVIGLSALLECHCDQRDLIYLCECCSMKIPEKDIISHVTGYDHQKMYLSGLKPLPSPPGTHQGMKFCHFAALLEKHSGYGEAQVMDLEKEIYDNVLEQNFKSAMQTVQALQAQQGRVSEPSSTSALSNSQPVDTSFSPQAHNEASNVLDNYEVVAMEFDGEANNSTTTTTSVAPDYSCTTTNSNIGESGYKCVTSTSSSNAKKTKLTAVNFNTGMTTNTTAAPSKSGTATSIKRRETAHTSMSSTSAMTTKSTAANFNTSITTSTSAASINSAITTNNSKTSNTSSVGANTTKSNRANPYTSTTVSPSAALTNSGTTTTTNRRENDFKYTSNKSINNTETPKSASDFLKHGTISTSNSTTSGESETTTSGEVSKPLQSRTSSTKGKHKANIASIVKETPLHTKVNSQPTATTSVKCGNMEASDKTALVKKSGGSNADVAPDKHNRPASKTTKIGVDQMIVVFSGKRRQLYCQLCAARLTCSDHPSTHRHQLNYVKMKLPHWTAEPSELKSKLANTVALYVELEQCAGAPKIQKLEVTMDVYDELKNLDNDKALARVTEMKRERDSGVSSTTADPGQVSTPDAHLSSPFDYSPDDETDLWQNETAGLSPEIQSVQESKHELQTSLVKITAIKKTPGNSTLTCEFESASPLAEASSCPETREQRNHQEKSDPELLVTQKVLEGSENTSPVNCSNPDELSSAPSVNAEQHDQPRPRQKAEEASEQSRCGSRPDHHRVASLGCSNLSTYLAVKNLDSELIIGRGSVWECRGISQKTFFLCESCSERLFLSDICQHMISVEHWLNHLMSKHPNIMTFWSLEDVTQEEKLVILKAIVKRTSEMERFPEIDATSKLLPPKEFEYVKTAPFSEALKFLQDSEKEQDPTFIYPPISTPQQKAARETAGSSGICAHRDEVSTGFRDGRETRL